MTPFSFHCRVGAALARPVRTLLVGLALALLPTAVLAQAPAWNLALSGLAVVTATATDASGNVYLTGYFGGSATFGSIQLSAGATGGEDMFVAKWDATGQTFTWATSGGGQGALANDRGNAIAVSGRNIYVAGFFRSGTSAVIAGQALAGAGDQDVFVAKYVDTSTGSTPATSSFANAWAVSGGGAGLDAGYGLAVSGPNVYVTGSFQGGLGASFAGQALAGAGLNNVFVVKYIDTSTGSTPATSSFANGWATGGGSTTQGNAIAVSGSNVYVTGRFSSGSSVVIAGQALAGAGSLDMFVAKYVDTSTGNTPATSSFADGWAVSGGGTSADQGLGLAVSGPNVYVTGLFQSSSGASFAGQALVGAGSFDMFVAKYVDTSTGSTPATSSFANAWATSGGGSGSDRGNAIVVSGRNVYVTGSFQSGTSTVIAGQALAGAGDQDVFVAKYVDTSTGNTPATSSFANAWATSGGGSGSDTGYGLAVSSAGVYAAGQVASSATFGSIAVGAGSNSYSYFLARLADTPLSTSNPASGLVAALAVYPNPASGAVTVAGTPARATVTVLDALGRPVSQATADAAGTAWLTLPAGLAAGFYLVRSGTQVQRLTVE